ncbi:MAG: hypothetical protein MUO43_06835 [Desulfobacterales bacterium]|nr:hypothetical protein [Desulfobacterales bacterium]
MYIDGANVAHKDNKTILASRIEIALNGLKKEGFESHALLPDYQVKKMEDPEIVEKLVQEGRLTLITNNDDLVVITRAYDNNACILTNDRFRDHKNKDWWSPEIDLWISNRLISFDIIEGDLSIPLDVRLKIEKYSKECSMYQLSVPEFKKHATNGGVSPDILLEELPDPVQVAIKLIPDKEITYSDWGSLVKNKTGYPLKDLFGNVKHAARFLKSRRYPVKNAKNNIYVKAAAA